ncbi:UNVERIFIED_CONTAM: hypothetical protein GTU68_003547 [Idotea baltica]|nr:hypothetical protein [Idotea baltica]
MSLTIHPSVGVARLGNSPGPFYLAPDQIGGLPYEPDADGNANGPVINFKDKAGRVRRQGQSFKVYRANGAELKLSDPDVLSITWTVHLANKKAAWYQYSELDGNLLYGDRNSYAAHKTPFRNATVTTEEERRKLIIDPGPRSVSGANQSASFDADSAPAGYPVSFPNNDPEYGVGITTLGNLLTTSEGSLIVLGGFGNAGGDEPLDSYGGSDTWHDDISDGPVYCTVTFASALPQVVKAWCIVGSPDYAPEIVNISNLSDTMFDVGVRCFNLVPSMYDANNGGWQEDFKANFKRDILPVIQRFGRYQWVANVQSMMAFVANNFDFGDPSASNLQNRLNYFSYFRKPDDKSLPSEGQEQAILFQEENGNMFPMMPLNSGSNSVSNAETTPTSDTRVEKFLALSETQYFLFSQWALGKFENSDNFIPYPDVSPLDQASVGNAVGLPMCPGIEVTWSLQNPVIYDAPYIINDASTIGGYDDSGLTPSRDECDGGGCQPGDLTKRMACPWQADFFQCTIQNINFTDPAVNKEDKVPKPPVYYSYWWPPQSPWDVLTGETTELGQRLHTKDGGIAHQPAGQQLNYARGINNFVQMVEHWSALAFIRDVNSGNAGFPYLTETERTNVLFTYDAFPVSNVSGNEDDNETKIPIFYIQEDPEEIAKKGEPGLLMSKALEERAFKKISTGRGLPRPRSGTNTRR